MNKSDIIEAADNMDWMQVLLNQGEPCFRLENDKRFCGRAKRWDGHGRIHKFISLADLVKYAMKPNPKGK